MIVDTNPLVLCLQNFKRRVNLEVFDDNENPVDATELVLQVQRVGVTGNSGSVVYNDDFIDPPPDGTRIKRTGVGQYNIVWGDPTAKANTPINMETGGRGKFLFVWSVVGPNGTEEEQVTQSLEIVTAHMMDRIREFQDQLDKARMQVSVDPKDFCPLGYTEGWLMQYLRGGMTLINSYQPYPTWLSVEDFSDTFLQTLFDASLVVAVNAQTLFAIASDVEQWCFAEGTPVTLADGTTKPVEDGVVGDRVLDRTGRIQTVENAWCEGMPREVTELELWGSRRFAVTPQHEWPVWAWMRKCLCGCGEDVKAGRLYAQGHHVRVVNKPKELHVRGSHVAGTPSRQSIPEGYEPMQRLRSDEIRAGDFMLVPRKFDAIRTDVTEDEARLLGYYAAEGNAVKSPAGEWTNLAFTFAEWERDTWAADIEAVLAQHDATVRIDPDARGRGIHVCTRSGRRDRNPNPFVWRLISLARAHVGEGSLTKRLSEEVMRWPVKLKRALVKGMLRGDGSQIWMTGRRAGKAGRSFSVQYSTSSPALLTQVQLILAQLGFPTRVSTNKPKLVRFRDGREYQSAPCYSLHVPAPYAFELARLVWDDESKAPEVQHGREGWSMPRPACMVDDDFIYVPVKSVRTAPNLRRVFNLTVSGDHSYLVNGIATYNSDQGNAFVINHQPKLAAFSQALAQRLDKLIPQMKLHFVRSGSVKIEAGTNFRINALLQMAPEGALFRNVFLASPQ